LYACIVWIAKSMSDTGAEPRLLAVLYALPCCVLLCFVHVLPSAGALHAYHPGIMQLRAFAAEQRAQGEAQLAAQRGSIAEHLQHVHEACEYQQAKVMDQMYAALVEQVGSTCLNGKQGAGN
jgi:hypothetical protein